MAVGSLPQVQLLVLSLAVLGYFSLARAFWDIALLLAFVLFRISFYNQQILLSRSLLYLVKIIGAYGAPIIVWLIIRLLRTSSSPLKWSGAGQVLLFPCRTTHSRLFPKKHSFSYSYLVVGIPVGWEGTAGGLISAGRKNDHEGNRRSWYDVDAGDYLERGSSHLGLRGKLDKFLRSEREHPADYPHAYLVTAARFLGYHFNPVSFWYLYDSDKSLAAMILEVNNTFGERRPYFLKPSDAEGERQIDDRGAFAQPRTSIKQVWPKDFHVSPFNSRKGTYSLLATDPLAPNMRGRGPIENTITLKSSKGHGKIVARLSSDGSVIDPVSISWFNKFRFLASWWWVGFVTFPRIVKEAGALFFRRKLHVWYRPEPLKESIGRTADSTERRLELVFRTYLRHLLKECDDAIAVTYIPSGIPDVREEIMLSGKAHEFASVVAEEVEFKVLTPVFYARFVGYAHDLEAMFCEFRESCTIWVSHPELLPKIFLKKPPPPVETPNYIEFAYFKAIQALRRKPDRIERPLTSNSMPSAASPVADIRAFRISSMDGYLLAKGDEETKQMYRSTVLKLFIADRVALGMVPLLELQVFAIKAILSWIIAGKFCQAAAQYI